jgi:hypothetical protein
VVLTRTDFVTVVNNTHASLGFAPEVAKVVLPLPVFLPGSDLSPIRENINKFTEGLTQWEPTIKEKKVITPPMLTLEGKDYKEAVTKMNSLFLRNMWSDGLPLLPATEESVKWIMRGTDLAPDTKIGKMLPRGGIATVETLAVALAMAGGRPEYLPLLIGAVQSLVDPDSNSDKWNSTSCSAFPAVIVNGPMARQIRLNSGWGLIGPDPLHPAGGSIGRAIRLLLQNVGGAIPGIGTMAQYGGMRYTNAVFAEDEEGLPKGWEPFSVEYLGYPKGENTVAVYAVSSATNVMGGRNLNQTAAFMRVAFTNQVQGPYEKGAPGILIMSSTIANQLADEGWTKKKIKEFLWENSKVPLSQLEKTGVKDSIVSNKVALQDPWPITSKPENLALIVAGGHHPSHAYWMQVAYAPFRLTRTEIKLPRDWDKLLKEAEEDLGPVPLQ